jgi:hypothetical protein
MQHAHIHSLTCFCSLDDIKKVDKRMYDAALKLAPPILMYPPGGGTDTVVLHESGNSCSDWEACRPCTRTQGRLLFRADLQLLKPLEWFNDCLVDFAVHYLRSNMDDLTVGAGCGM